MRRSAAPSVRADIKRARFLPQILKNISPNKNESDLSYSSENAFSAFKETTNKPLASSDVSITKNNIIANTETLRSDRDVLDLLLDEDSSSGKNSPLVNDVLVRNDKNNANNLSQTLETFVKPKQINNKIKISAQNEVVEESKSLSNCLFCINNDEEATLFNVVYCKRSGKKHKTWEGDGFLIVKTRSAVLKDCNGKILDKGLGYKLKETEALEEGSKFFIGGKECEIQCKVPQEDCQSGKYCKCIFKDEIVKQPAEKSPPPVKNYKPC